MLVSLRVIARLIWYLQCLHILVLEVISRIGFLPWLQIACFNKKNVIIIIIIIITTQVIIIIIIININLRSTHNFPFDYLVSKRITEQNKDSNVRISNQAYLLPLLLLLLSTS